jgi:hypothetical protein
MTQGQIGSLIATAVHAASAGRRHVATTARACRGRPG